jgi:hypothetical protein
MTAPVDNAGRHTFSGTAIAHYICGGAVGIAALISRICDVRLSDQWLEHGVLGWSKGRCDMNWRKRRIRRAIGCNSIGPILFHGC